MLINEFLEKADHRVLVLALTPQGQIVPSYSFPASSRTKVGGCVTSVVYLDRHESHQCIQYINTPTSICSLYYVYILVSLR